MDACSDIQRTRMTEEEEERESCEGERRKRLKRELKLEKAFGDLETSVAGFGACSPLRRHKKNTKIRAIRFSTFSQNSRYGQMAIFSLERPVKQQASNSNIKKKQFKRTNFDALTRWKSSTEEVGNAYQQEST